MRIYELFEAINIDKTLANYGQALIRRVQSDSSASNLSQTQIIQKCIDADPTQNKQYALWIIRTYSKGGINRFEDLGRTNQALDLLFRNKDKLPVSDRDIGKIKSLPDLESLVEPFEKQQARNS